VKGGEGRARQDILNPVFIGLVFNTHLRLPTVAGEEQVLKNLRFEINVQIFARESIHTSKQALSPKYFALTALSKHFTIYDNFPISLTENVGIFCI
jgi:hypothetical protein